MEATIRERVGSRIKRGKVDCTLRFHAAPAELRDLNINSRLAADLIQAADNIGSMIGPTTPISSFDVLRWPGVIEADEIELDTVSQELLRMLDQALDELLQTRRREGNKLKTMIVQRCTGIREQLQVLCSRVPEIIESLRGRYEQRVHEVAQGLDASRVEQECALLVQRLDVAEELDRIGAHVDEVLRVLDQKEPIGRRLDFLMQELNREANTLGSKSAHIDTANASVELKVLIEQMREQVQNIE